MSVQIVPSPLYPALQVHELVPGPVCAHAAFVSQPPLLVRQLSIDVQVIPSPE